MVGIIGGVVVALGLVVLVLGLMRPRRVALKCEGTTCVLQQISVLRTKSTEIKNLRGANAEEKRRGSRDNVRLVLQGDTDIEMAPWTSRGDRNAYAFRDAASKIQAYVGGGSKGELDVAIDISQTLVLWMAALTLLGIGGIMVAIYFTGSKVKIDGRSGEYHGKQRGALSELASVGVRGHTIVATRRDGGDVVLLRAMGRKGSNKPDLGPATERIRSYLS